MPTQIPYFTCFQTLNCESDLVDSADRICVLPKSTRVGPTGRGDVVMAILVVGGKFLRLFDQAPLSV